MLDSAEPKQCPMNMRSRASLTAILVTTLYIRASAGVAVAATNLFVNWGTAPLHPFALCPDGSRLAGCNLPRHRLELVDVGSGISVPFGNEPRSLESRFL